MSVLINLSTARNWLKGSIPDHLSAYGREKARKRAIAMTAAASIFAKGISIAVTLISVPLTLNYLGTERFGMWMVISSFTLLLGFLDLGVGNSTLNAVALSSASKDTSELQRKISSAYAVACIVTGILLLLIIAFFNIISWQALFNVESAQAVAEAGPASAVFFVILALSTPINLIFRIQLGLQQGFRSNLWQSAGSILALAAIYAATRMEASLPWLVVALIGAPAVITAINTIHFFCYTRQDLRPSFVNIEASAMLTLLSGGFMFLTLQVCTALMFQSNVIIVAQLLGPEAVPIFAIPEKLFGLVSFVVALILVPLWPAYGEAIRNGDIDWIKRTFRKSIIFSATVATTLSVVFVAAGPTIIEWWVGDVIAVPFSVLLGFGLWKIMESVGNAVAMLLNGLNAIGLQAVLAVLNTVMNLLLKIWLVERLGLPGVMLATILAYGVFSLPWLALQVRRSPAGQATQHNKSNAK